MRSLFITILVLIVSFPSFGESQNIEVESINVSGEGLYRPGFMWWYNPNGLFMYPSDLIVLGSVTEVSEIQPSAVVEDDLRGQIFHGYVLVQSVIRCPKALRRHAEQVKVIECDGFKGLDVGDIVLVFLVPYEGAYAVPNRVGTNTALGYKLEPQGSSRNCDAEAVIQLFSIEDPWNITTLTTDQLLLWSKIDPQGLAIALIMNREARE